MACGLLALTRPQFHAIESVQEFDDQLRGAVVTRLWQEDQWGYLRRDLLIAQGVKYPEGPADDAPPQKDDAPTFERVMGRPPVSTYDPFGLSMALAYLEESSPGSLPWTARGQATRRSELEQEEAADPEAEERGMRAWMAQAEAQIRMSGIRIEGDPA